MIKYHTFVFAACGLAAALPACGADVDAGKALAQKTCAACHGTDGMGLIDQYPNLAGQKAAYLAAQMKAFRDGSRQNPIMSPMAKPLSDADIENLAAYFSHLTPR
jgi:cytochrome c553